jgi:plasmid stabilization system protein ParE
MPEEMDRLWSLRLTRRARTDIEAAHVSLAENAGLVIADAWQEGLEAVIASLSHLPQRCSAAQEADLFPAPLVRQLIYRRSRSSPAYRILFRLHDNPDDAPFVRLIALRHGAQAPLTADEAQVLHDEDE